MSLLGINKLQYKNVAEEMQQAMKNGDDAKVIESLESLQNTIAQNIKSDFEEYQQTQDKSILADRGYRQLTIAEEKWYKGFIEASRSPRPEQRRRYNSDFRRGNSISCRSNGRKGTAGEDVLVVAAYHCNPWCNRLWNVQETSGKEESCSWDKEREVK